MVEQHGCVEVMHFMTSLRSNLMSTCFSNVLYVFVDGSCSRPYDNRYYIGCFVVMLPDVSWKAPLTASHHSL